MKIHLPKFQKKPHFKWRSAIPLLIFFPVSVFAQSLDSLEQVLATKKLTDQEKINLYNDLSWGYTKSNLDRSIFFGKKGLVLSQKNKNEKMEATFFKNLGIAYYRGAVYDTAVIYLEKARPIADKLQEYLLQSSIYNANANIYKNMGQYDLALENYLITAKILEAHSDKQKLALLYSNIGGVYQMMQNFGQALKYFTMAEKLAAETDNQLALGGIYVSLSDITSLQKKPKEVSVDYAHKAIEIFKKFDNKHFEYRALNALASVYYRHKNYDAAETIAHQVIVQSKKMGFPSLTFDAYGLLSDIYLQQEQYAQSAELARTVLEIDSTDINITQDAYFNLVIANAYLEHPELTKKYMYRYQKVLDQYANETYQNSLSGMEVKYETEKKELKIQTLKEQRQLYTWLAVLAGIVLLAALAFAFVRYRLAVSQRKLAEEENLRLEQEKQLSATSALLQGQEDERSRMAKELHDGLGGLLSGVKHNLNNMHKKLIITEEDGAAFEKSIHLLDESINELRRVAHNLMPESILKYGLDGAINEYLQSIQNENLNIVYQSYHIENGLGKQLDISVYRIVQELVNNTLKHANATEILVQVRKDEQLLVLDVEDNGNGFEYQSGNKERGMGLTGISSRVQYWKGNLNIQSDKETGTAVHIEIPI